MIVLAIVGILVATPCVWLAWKRFKFNQIMSIIPGPKAWPIVGNALQLKRHPNEFFVQLRRWAEAYADHGLFCIWLGFKPVVVLYQPEYVEVLLSSQKNITKTPLYNFLHPWLGTGLLTSTGSKWKSRRKLLTPTFHFKILNGFVSVHQKQSGILIELLQAKAGRGEFDIAPYITLCVLDDICETSMGADMKTQLGGNLEYAKAVFGICDVIQQRQKSPWLWPDFIYNMTSAGRRHEKFLSVLHGFTNKVINERIEQRKEQTDVNEDTAVYSASHRRVQAFLDLLLEEYDHGNITKEGVREEVDTFMFEGHDTTSASLQWVIHLLSKHPEVQAQLQHEVDRFFESVDENIKPEQLKELIYLECVIKEALRLWPSVPLFGRELTEGCYFGPYYVPEGCSVLVAPMALHLNPHVWNDPHVFNPERFLLENTTGRHPFSFVPFSAGPRNCIGQRFAMMEEKVILASIVRHFNITSSQDTENMQKTSEIILKSTEGILVSLEKRRF